MSEASDFRAPHLGRSDFLGVFAVVEGPAGILMVQNERVIGGKAQTTWDLPGGQVEPGELLGEALARELREETGLELQRRDLLFVQDGEKVIAGARHYAWRSFFFRAATTGTPVAGAEVRAVRVVPRAELPPLLTAPYHDSFRTWLRTGGSFFASTWRE